MKDLRGSKCYVTGATGFIGHALVDHLLGQGAQVIALSKHPGTKVRRVDERVFLYVGDTRDYRLHCDIIASHEVDYVIHLAANSIVRTSANDPLNT